MKLLRATLAVTMLIMLAGCASLTFHTDEKMSGANEVGLKAYYAKPYILVARDGTSKVTGVSLVYLPDLEKPVYAKAKSGYGSANLSLAFSNGIITSFGQVTDTKIPETLTALGGVNTSLMGGLKTRAETDILQKQSGDFGKYSGELKNIATELRALVVDDKSNILAQNQRITLDTNANLLDGGAKEGNSGGLAAAFAAPGAAANGEKLLKDLASIEKGVGSVKPASEQLSEDAKKVWEKLAGLQANLKKIVDSLQPKAAEPPALSLYEVQMQGGKTVLTEVQFGPDGP